MKKILLIAVTLAASNLTSAQILSQNFEGAATAATFPPSGWTRDTQVSNRPWGPTAVLSTTLQDDFLINGTNSAFINYIAGQNTANLISPSFSLVGYSAATFNFSAVVGWSYMIDQGFGDLFAKVSINGGATWTQVWVEEDSPEFVDDGDGDPDTDLYANAVADVSIDMAPYLGQANVKIKFEYTGDDADGVSVDDIVISGTLSTNDFLAGKFSIYPNPAKNLISVINTENINVTGITIADLNGRIVKTVKNNNISDIQVNVSDLAAGMYVMNINSDQGIATKKIVKE